MSFRHPPAGGSTEAAAVHEEEEEEEEEGSAENSTADSVPHATLVARGTTVVVPHAELVADYPFVEGVPVVGAPAAEQQGNGVLSKWFFRRVPKALGRLVRRFVRLRSAASPPLPPPPESDEDEGGPPSSGPTYSSSGVTSPATKTAACAWVVAPPSSQQLRRPTPEIFEQEEQDDEDQGEEEEGEEEDEDEAPSSLRRGQPQPGPPRQVQPGAVRVRGPGFCGGAAEEDVGTARKDDKERKKDSEAADTAAAIAASEGDQELQIRSDLILDVTSSPAAQERRLVAAPPVAMADVKRRNNDAIGEETTRRIDTGAGINFGQTLGPRFVPPQLMGTRQTKLPEASRYSAAAAAAGSGGGGGGGDSDDEDDEEEDDESSTPDVPHLQDSIDPHGNFDDFSVQVENHDAASTGNVNGPGFHSDRTTLASAMSEAASAAAEATAAASKAEAEAAKAKANASKAEAALNKLSRLIGLAPNGNNNVAVSMSPQATVLAPFFSIEEIRYGESDSSIASSITLSNQDSTEEGGVCSLPLSNVSNDSSIPGMVAVEGDDTFVRSTTSYLSTDEKDWEDGGTLSGFQEGETLCPPPYCCTKGLGVLGLTLTDKHAKSTPQSATDTTSLDAHLKAERLIPAISPNIILNILRLRPAYQFIPTKDLLSLLRPYYTCEEIAAALDFLHGCGVVTSCGGRTEGALLSTYIILDPIWKDSMLRILKDALPHHVLSTHRQHNLPHNDIQRTLLSNSSCCPLLTDEQFSVLCHNLGLANDHGKSSSLVPAEEKSSSAEVLKLFKGLLIDSGFFLPFNVASTTPSNQSQDLVFIPGILDDVQDMQQMWTFMSACKQDTTLCHKWHIDSNMPANLMEHLTLTILEDLYAFSEASQHKCVVTKPQASIIPSPRPLHRRRSESHSFESTKILQVSCWKTSLLITFSTVVKDKENPEPKRFIIEVFIALVDQDSPNCVGKDEIEGEGAKCLLVAGRGPVANNGKRLWQGGYQVVVESTRTFLARYLKVDVNPRVACNVCLATLNPQEVTTWSCNETEEAFERHCAHFLCRCGHRANLNTMCGKVDNSGDEASMRCAYPHAVNHIHNILPSVVLVCVFDRRSNMPMYAGSGFLIDAGDGLIATAAHVLFNMKDTEDSSFSSLLFDPQAADVRIGIVSSKETNADFCYAADIVTANPNQADVCILQLRNHLGEKDNFLLDSAKGEKLSALEMTTQFQHNEPVCLIGFNQGGEGLSKPGERLNLSVGLSRGYICMDHKIPQGSGGGGCFRPLREIVVNCSTIGGHSGGPMVSEGGKVVGLLSSADLEGRRCYVVPSCEIMALAKRAKAILQQKCL